MEQLKQRIQEEGKIRGTNEILKVDSFLNHQIDVAFLAQIGQAFRDRFDGCQVDRILTIEASGIGIACLAAQAFGNVPVVFAKKNRTKNIAGDVFISQVESFTQSKRPYNIFVSKEFLKPGEKVLLIDDFLANGSALSALSLCELSLHVGSIDDGERVANIHIVALFDTQFEHTSRHLARHAIFRHLDISLYNFRLALENKSADNSYYYNHDGESRHREQYVLMLCFFRHNVCFYCSVPSAFLRFT